MISPDAPSLRMGLLIGYYSPSSINDFVLDAINQLILGGYFRGP